MYNNINFPVGDWKYEVANNDTRLGYHEWVKNKMECSSSQHYDTRINPFLVSSLDISTGHLTEQDNNLLNSSYDDDPVTAYKYTYGYIVFVGDVPASGYLPEEYDEIIKKYGYSDTFIDILKKARELNCKYVQFDADGAIYDDIPSFEW